MRAPSKPLAVLLWGALGVACAAEPSASSETESSETGSDSLPQPAVGWECAPDAASDAVAAYTLENLSVWGWEAGVASVGLLRHALCTDDTASLDALASWVYEQIEIGVDPFHDVNDAVAAFTAIGLYRYNGDEALLDEARRLADYYVDEHPKVEFGAMVHAGDQLWVDTTFMVAPMLAQLGVITGEARYVDEAITQVTSHAFALQDPQSGLYFHGWDFSDAGAGIDPNGGKGHWGRGQAWSAASTAEVLVAIGTEHPRAPELIEILQAQLEALMPLQTGEGLWHTVVDRPEMYLEASGTAGIAHAINLAVYMQLLPAEHLDAVSAARAALAQRVEPEGWLDDVSGPTKFEYDADAYGEVVVGMPREYGHGLYLLLSGGPADSD